MLLLPDRLRGARTPPADVDDAVKLWARQNGRTNARLKWIPHAQAWAVLIDLKSDDPRLKKWQEGDLDQPEPPTESFLLHEWDAEKGRYVGFDLEEYGPSGIRELLDRWNTWSGRGEYESPVDAVQDAIEKNRKRKEENKAKAREVGQEIAWLGRRTALDLPQVSVDTDIETVADYADS